MGFEWIPKKQYKRHYICLGCQKGFKRPPKEDMKHDESVDLSNLMHAYYEAGTAQDIVKHIREKHDRLQVVCPHCQHHMIHVHYDFEVPPQRDHKSWKKLRMNLQAKTELDYTSYIHWHKLALKEEGSKTAQFRILQRNLEKLEQAQKDRNKS